MGKNEQTIADLLDDVNSVPLVMKHGLKSNYRVY